MQRMGAIVVFDNECNIVDLMTEILSDMGSTVRTAFESTSAPTAGANLAPALLDLALSARTIATTHTATIAIE
jgi:hypothetical protein